MNEDKVREAIQLIEQSRICIPVVEKLLKEAIAPEKPEIPEGCPVLVRYYEDGPLCKEFYYGERNYDGSTVEIDYERKGHVIPWHGGSMDLFAGNLTYNMFVFTRGGTNGVLKKEVKGFSWEWANDAEQSKYDIIAYVIWPEWGSHE